MTIVSDTMHTGTSIAWVAATDTLRDVIISMTDHPLGAACVIDAHGRLQGIITDGDLRRALQKHDDIRTLRAADVMTSSPVTIAPEATLREAVRLMEDRPSQLLVLPVVDDMQRCIGLIRIHDIYLPRVIPPHSETFELASNVLLGGNQPVVIAGPCVIESYDVAMRVAEHLKGLSDKLSFPFVFKSSFDKANRTSRGTFRSIGMHAALSVIERIRVEFGIPVVTDVHDVQQITMVADIVDILQIPALLCRQTDLLEAAAKTGKPVNIKRGQFMAPEDMAYAVGKVRALGNERAILTERGFSFGYHNLVVDMRALPIMRQFAPVVFDVTHSVQMPGGLRGRSGGQREFGPYLARAAAAVGIDGFFIETHPEPSKALSDGPNMIPLNEMHNFLQSVLTIWTASRPFVRDL